MMRTYARIQDGAVFELFSTDGDIAQMFAPELVWIDVTSISPAPQVGWLYTPPASFAAPPAPTPTPAQLLAEKLAAGIAITSTSTPALDATYALDDVTLNQIGAVARDAAAGLGLPGGLSTFTYPDITGTPRTFIETTIQAVYKAMRDLVFAMQTTAATLDAGGSADWPPQTATIT